MIKLTIPSIDTPQKKYVVPSEQIYTLFPTHFTFEEQSLVVRRDEEDEEEEPCLQQYKEKESARDGKEVQEHLICSVSISDVVGFEVAYQNDTSLWHLAIVCNRFSFTIRHPNKEYIFLLYEKFYSWRFGNSNN